MRSGKPVCGNKHRCGEQPGHPHSALQTLVWNPSGVGVRRKCLPAGSHLHSPSQFSTPLSALVAYPSSANDITSLRAG